MDDKVKEITTHQYYKDGRLVKKVTEYKYTNKIITNIEEEIEETIKGCKKKS